MARRPAYRDFFARANPLLTGVTNPVVPLYRAFATRTVRYLLIGVPARICAPGGGATFVTKDHDFFLPPDRQIDNLVRAWNRCEDHGLKSCATGKSCVTGACCPDFGSARLQPCARLGETLR